MRAVGLELAQALRPHGFWYHIGFAAAHLAFRGLDYPFTLALVRCMCCPSSLYTFPQEGAWFGIASEHPPDFEQFCSWGFPPWHSMACAACRRLARPRGFDPMHAVFLRSARRNLGKGHVAKKRQQVKSEAITIA